MVSKDKECTTMKSNTSKYRYDRVTMGILMSDFAFSKGSAAPGDLFPDFKIASTDGEMIAKEHFLDKRPLLVVFGSATCPMTASSIESLKRLHTQYDGSVTPDRRAFPAFLVLFGIISAFAGTVAAVLA
jgi:hypothetical protein